MKNILIFSAFLLSACSQEVSPHYSAKVRYEYHFELKKGLSQDFYIHFLEDHVLINSQEVDVQFSHCGLKTCHWRNESIVLKHHYQSGLVEISAISADGQNCLEPFAMYAVSRPELQVPGIGN